MKKLQVFSWVMILAVLAGCTSSQKMLERGQYDRAIDRASEKLMKRPGNEKELRVLTEAYEIANQFDRERIEFLELEGREESWVEIYELYEQLNNRQMKVRRLPSQIRNQFTFHNYDEAIIASKSAAADVSYRRGLEFLERDGKENARLAYEEFRKASAIYPGYEDTDQLLAKSHQLGRSHALFVMENNSGRVVPEYFETELMKIALTDLETHWLGMDSFENGSVEYDYLLVLEVSEVSFSPERVNRNTFSEEAEIQDGMRYKLDRRGNVAKDSLGNDIRVPNMVQVSAEITEIDQNKSVFVGGSVDLYDLKSDQLLRTDPVTVEAVFQNIYGTFSGDERALSDESRQIVGGREVSFPSNEQMLMDATVPLKDRALHVISRNRRYMN